ncbi:hypothetical protein GLGCALEP_00256 [Pseudomonas sp. MM221]|nr:hypothetical protein DBADOPDK_00251 [Pseudomonas sp. MM223]CAI3791755.1 hypothetical protein GLGCALEP_00256 [Pseudomonas sp. MM221]
MKGLAVMHDAFDSGGGFSDEVLGFVITCLFCGAINCEEFQSWSAQVLATDQAPAFMNELMTFDEPLFKVFAVIGHVPHWPHVEAEEHALYGIAVCRGIEPFDMPVSPQEARQALVAEPGIEAVFRQVFDFIAW